MALCIYLLIEKKKTSMAKFLPIDSLALQAILAMCSESFRCTKRVIHKLSKIIG